MRGVAIAFCFCSVLTMVESRAEENSPVTEAHPLTSLSNSILHDLDALFLLQDATAQGLRDAAALQKALLVSIGETLLKPGTQQPDGLAPYIAGYILSGGDPSVVSTFGSLDKLSPHNRQLLEGVSEFMVGNREKASELLGKIEIASLPARITGRVALARALLETDLDARQAGLAIAAASMPGSLVEESALRRSALSYAEAGDDERFWKRLERYQRRFPDSLYARPFWEDVMRRLIDRSRKGTAPDLTRLTAIMGSMTGELKRDLYLLLAREAAIAGQVSLMEFAALKVQEFAEAGSPESHVAKLYLSLYSVASERGGAAVADLQSLDRTTLLPRERALLEAGIWIAQQISRPPAASRSAESQEEDQKSQLQTQAEDLLRDVEKVLEESNS